MRAYTFYFLRANSFEIAGPTTNNVVRITGRLLCALSLGRVREFLNSADYAGEHSAITLTTILTPFVISWRDTRYGKFGFLIRYRDSQKGDVTF